MAKNDAGFERELMDVFEGRATFDALVRRQRHHFRALAGSIFRRWRLPGWVTPEDVEQDILLGAWESLWNYEQHRGKSITGYIVYNAYDKAKKRAHKARNAVRSGNRVDSNPGRMDRTFGAVWGDDGDRRAEEVSAQPPRQEEVLLRKEVIARIMRGSTFCERLLLAEAERQGVLEDVIAGEPYALAGCLAPVYEDRAARERAGWDSELQALAGLVDASARVAERVMAEFEAA